MRNYAAKLVDSSRAIADILTQDVGNDQERFTEMLQLTLCDEYPLSMRAARIVALCVENYPALINPHITPVINRLPGLRTEGVVRGMLKLFAENSPELSEEQTGILIDLAFTWLEDSRKAIAIRYYCIEIILTQCATYPELKNELAIILKNLSNDPSPGISSRSKAVLREFRKKGMG